MGAFDWPGAGFRKLGLTPASPAAWRIEAWRAAAR